MNTNSLYLIYHGQNRFLPRQAYLRVPVKILSVSKGTPFQPALLQWQV